MWLNIICNKLKYITNDEKEILNTSFSRSNLNFGHTFGHALESINNYDSSLTHGEAISIGMVLAAKISNLIGDLPNKQLNQIINHFKNIGLPIKYEINNKNKFLKIIINDKKNHNEKINLILLEKIGRAFYAKNFKFNKIKKILSQIT